ncbi:MAG: precorrin-6y C5,15-methyltransferase (decarboxylating) subunit CbiE [Pirellulaceae bacterium]|nr:precorrin-6y C5,15-methyltransferase (decarboxylating) subunit CbiE [Pirellulaceae bacterium]MDP7018266.1 precorrin-6y C5,15-methyltransferase (decarboxylating) subunit CbiE [Pirellulaceae bacterium]
MTSREKVQIVGIGDDGLEGLTSAARQTIQAAEILIGAPQCLQLLPVGSETRVAVSSDLSEVVQTIESNRDRRVVLLATGDPLFYGTARYLCEHLGKDRFEVAPHVSSMQLAFARVKESWDEAYLANLATTELERVVEKIRSTEKAGLFTTDNASPAVVAQALLDCRIDYFTAYVCENLGSPDERVTHAELSEVAEQEFAALNVLILVRNPDTPDRPTAMVGRRLFGNPDELFLQSRPKRGLLTPSEIRSIALAELDLGQSSIVWDVGAGSGSVAIEAAQIASSGVVYAIEMDPEDHVLISANAERFQVDNLKPILGQAPDAWADLPDPDAIFVGGTGRQVEPIVERALERLRPGGRLVANVASLENVVAVRALLEDRVGDANVWMVQVSRGNYQLERLALEALNPSFLVGVRVTG